ncbi:glycosyltransferase family 4 protein [Sulfuriflexus mobilis]|uniref:glycosyltransferase family 4 protein n=1 Tax=Sulfuriflexus mobilis TaxID=1811807 RepID=UPI000F8483ED|nr:glycosyltransferase family 4 protein [Sulfuriflexus mobilis]
MADSKSYTNNIVFVGLSYAIDNYFSNHIDVLSENSRIEIIKLDEHIFFKFVYGRRSILSLPLELLLMYLFFLFRKSNLIITAGPKVGLICSIVSYLQFNKKHLHWFTGQVWAVSKNKFLSASYWVDYFISRFSDFLFCDGMSQAEFLAKGLRKPRSCFVVPNGGSINGIKEEYFTINSHERAVSNRGLNIVYVGRIAEEKGVFTILEIAELVRQSSELPDVNFVIAGPVEKYFKNYSLFQEKLAMLDNVQLIAEFVRPLDVLSKGDIFIFPSHREGFGLVLLEAQASGLPVLVSDIYGVRDSLVDKETGFICENDNAYDFFGKIKFFYENPSVMATFSKNAVTFAEKFRESNFREHLLEAYSVTGLT